MKKHIPPIICIVVATLLFSCQQLSKEEQEFDTRMQQIINVHDEVMPKMGEMSSLIKELESKIDTTPIGQTYTKAQTDLKNSYDFMMDWMADFSTKFPHGEEVTSTDKKQFDIKMQLLKEEEIEVNTLKQQINTSIEQAKQLLKKQ